MEDTREICILLQLKEQGKTMERKGTCQIPLPCNSCMENSLHGNFIKSSCPVYIYGYPPTHNNILVPGTLAPISPTLHILKYRHDLTEGPFCYKPFDNSEVETVC